MRSKILLSLYCPASSPCEESSYLGTERRDEQLQPFHKQLQTFFDHQHFLKQMLLVAIGVYALSLHYSSLRRKQITLEREYMTKTVVYLTRHGQTEWNVVRRMQGYQDSPLTELGILQATWLRDAMLDVDLAALYASTSQRAVKTAEIIRAQRPLEIITYDAFREIDMGDWEGKTIDEIQQMDAQGLDTFWRKPTEYVPTNSGESFHDLQNRVIPVLDEIIARNLDRTIMIVSHGITLKLMLTHLEQRPLAKLWDPPFIQPTALSKVVIEDSVTTLELNGDTTHYREGETHP